MTTTSEGGSLPPYPGGDYPPPGPGYPPPGSGFPPPGSGFPPPGPGYPPPGPGYPGWGYPGGGYPPPGPGHGYGGDGGYGFGTGPPYASYWARAGGFLIDAIILFVVDGIVGSALTAGRVGSVHYHTSTGTAYISVASYVVELLIWLAYGALFIGSRRGQTLGMMAVGVRAVDRDRGTPIGLARALGRAAFEYLMGLILVIGWIVDMLWPAWDARRQTLHDKVTHTVVVKAAMVPPPPAR